MVTKIFTPGPNEFRQWRLELGLTEEEIAGKAGVTVDNYRVLESGQYAGVGDMGETYGRVVAAFRGLGKDGVIAVDGHSTLQ